MRFPYHLVISRVVSPYRDVVLSEIPATTVRRAEDGMMMMVVMMREGMAGRAAVAG